MFMERMALEATLRREELTSEARTYHGLQAVPAHASLAGMAACAFGRRGW